MGRTCSSQVDGVTNQVASSHGSWLGVSSRKTAAAACLVAPCPSNWKSGTQASSFHVMPSTLRSATRAGNASVTAALQASRRVACSIGSLCRPPLLRKPLSSVMKKLSCGAIVAIRGTARGALLEVATHAEVSMIRAAHRTASTTGAASSKPTVARANR